MIFDRPEDALQQLFVGYFVDNEEVRTEAFPDRLRPAEWNIVSKGLQLRLSYGDGWYYLSERVWFGPFTTTGFILVWSEKDVVVASWNHKTRVTLSQGDTLRTAVMRLKTK